MSSSASMHHQSITWRTTMDYRGNQGKYEGFIINGALSCWILSACATTVTRMRTSRVRGRGLFTTRRNKTWHSMHITSWVHRADCAIRPDIKSVLRLCNEQHCCVSQDLQFASFTHTHSLLNDWFQCQREAHYWVAATELVERGQTQPTPLSRAPYTPGVRPRSEFLIVLPSSLPTDLFLSSPPLLEGRAGAAFSAENVLSIFPLRGVAPLPTTPSLMASPTHTHTHTKWKRPYHSSSG
jgi:hypothetical protein